MASADVTYHPVKDFPRFRYDEVMGCWPDQTGDSEQLDFTSGTSEGAVASEPVIARVVSDINCRVTVGENAEATLANSRLVVGKVTEAVFVPEGHRISVMA